MIRPIQNKAFMNRESIGSNVNVSFDTYIDMSGGKTETIPVQERAHYLDQGEGDALLLLHGAAQSLYTFHENFRPLSEKYHVIAPDLLGHGYSGCPDIMFTVGDYSLFIGAFMDALNIEKVHIMAFGQSAAYAFGFAIKNPERVGGLIIEHPGGFADTQFPGARAVRGGLGARALSKFAKQLHVEKCMDKSYFDKTLISASSIKEFALPFESAQVRECVRRAITNYDAEDLFEQMGALENKVLYIVSQDDSVSSKYDLEKFMSFTKNAYSSEIRNCGYFPHEEKAERVNSLVREFLVCI